MKMDNNATFEAVAYRMETRERAYGLVMALPEEVRVARRKRFGYRRVCSNRAMLPGLPGCDRVIIPLFYGWDALELTDFTWEGLGDGLFGGTLTDEARKRANESAGAEAQADAESQASARQKYIQEQEARKTVEQAVLAAKYGFALAYAGLLRLSGNGYVSAQAARELTLDEMRAVAEVAGVQPAVPCADYIAARVTISADGFDAPVPARPLAEFEEFLDSARASVIRPERRDIKS